MENICEEIIKNKYEFIDQCLKEFNYPFGNYYNDDLESVLKPINRGFFIAWFFKTLEPEVFQNNVSENFGNLIYQYGFCSQKRNKEFIEGKLPKNDELTIFYKMFKYLKDTVNNKENEWRFPINLNDINKLSAVNLNLFEHCGPLLVITDKQREQLIKQYKAEIEELRSVQNGEYEAHKTLDSNLQEILKKNMQKLEEFVPYIMRNMKEFLNKTKDLRENKVKIHKNLKDVMEKASESSIFVNKVLQDMGLLLNYQNRNNFNVPIKSPEPHETTFFIEDLAEDVQKLNLL